MKLFIPILFFTQIAFSQSLTSEEQKRLIQDNQSLRAENKRLQEELAKVKGQNSADTARMMEVLQKGKKYQEEQLKALEELDQDL